MANIFLSYARVDADPLKTFVEHLRRKQHQVWIDTRDLPEASQWRDEIRVAIDRSDVLLVAVSKNSLSSTECLKEFQYARGLGKRVVPVAIDDAQAAAAPPDLADVNWIRLSDAHALTRIETAISTELQHLRQHTRFLLAAREWQRHHGAVLRGANLREAEEWLAIGDSKEPRPTEEHRTLIAASLSAEKRRRTAGGLSVVLFFAVVVGLLVAENKRRESQRLALANRLADESFALWTTKNYEESMLRAVAAYQAAPTSSARRALLNAAQAQPELEIILHGHEQEVEALAFDPRGRFFVSAGEDDDGIHLFDRRTWKSSGTIGAQMQRISHLRFSKDGAFLLSADLDGVIRQWNIETRIATQFPPTTRGLLEDLSLHPDDRFMAAGYSAGGVVWNLTSIPPTATELPLTPSRRVNAVLFTDDGRSLLVVEGTETLIRWRFAAGVLSNRREFRPGTAITTLAEHGNTVAAALSDGTIVWMRNNDLTELRRVAAHPGAHIHALAFDSTGSQLVSAASDGTVRVWRGNSGAGTVAFTSRKRVMALAFEPGSSRLAVSGSDPAIYVLNLERRQPLAQVVSWLRASVQEAVFDAAGTSLLVKTLSGSRWKINVASRDKELLEAEEEHDDVTAMAERASVRATGHKDGTINVWRGSAAKRLSGARLSFVMALAFSPDGELIVAGDNEGTVAAWDAKTLNFVRSWKTSNAAAASLAFSPRGDFLAIVDAGTSRVSVIKTNASTIRALDGGCPRVFSIAFSRDGSLLVTGCEDGSLELLDVETRERLGRISDYEDRGEPDFVNALSRHPARDLFASGIEDGRIILWNLDAPSWMRSACRRANRDLAADEIEGWRGEPFVPCSALLRNAPPDTRPPDVERENTEPRVPINVARRKNRLFSVVSVIAGELHYAHPLK